MQYISCTVASNISATHFPEISWKEKSHSHLQDSAGNPVLPSQSHVFPHSLHLTPLTSVNFYCFISTAIIVTSKSTEQYSWYKEKGIKMRDRTKFQSVIIHHWGPGEKTAASTVWTDQWMTDSFTDFIKLLTLKNFSSSVCDLPSSSEFGKSPIYWSHSRKIGSYVFAYLAKQRLRSTKLLVSNAVYLNMLWFPPSTGFHPTWKWGLLQSENINS